MKNVETSDGELLVQYASGSQKAFETLVRRHQSRLYTTAYMVLRDRYEAQDVVQETFLKAVLTVRNGRYQEEGKLLPWLMRITHNLCIDKIRRRQRNPEVVMEDGSPVFSLPGFSTESVEERQMGLERHDQLRDCIKRLPEAQREVLLLRHFGGMSFREIAEHTDVSINTALGRMRYALINLRKQMQPNTHQYDKNFYPAG